MFSASDETSWSRLDNEEKESALMDFWKKYIEPAKDITSPGWILFREKPHLSNINHLIRFKEFSAETKEKKFKYLEDSINFFDRKKNTQISWEEFKEFFYNRLSTFDLKLLNISFVARSASKAIESIIEVNPINLNNLRNYMSENHISASVSLGNANSDIITIHTSGILPIHTFAIHSVAKVFTGTLVLKMVEIGIFPEVELKLTLGESDFFRGFIGSLPDAFKNEFGEHLKNVTVHQLMTHKGGLGDYYDNSEGYRSALEKSKIPKIDSIADFLQFAEPSKSELNLYRYSNIGITLVGLIIEHAYNKFREEHKKENLDNLDFNGILNKFIIKAAKINNFSSHIPTNGKFNLLDTCAQYMVGGPAGSYWTTSEDLSKFGKWLFDECKKPTFKALLERYGEEFYHNGVVDHPGFFQSSSAVLSVSLNTGNIIAIVSDQPEVAPVLGLTIQRNLYVTPKVNNKVELVPELNCSTSMISKKLDVLDTHSPAKKFVQLEQSSENKTTADAVDVKVEAPTPNKGPTPFSPKLSK